MKNLKTEKENMLLIGIGNSGRTDDGLGWKFIELVSKPELTNVDYEFRYQLQVEDVLLVSRYDKVVFIDASHAEFERGFKVQPCRAAQHYFFSSHIQSPETILYLAKEIYNKTPEAYLLAITGKKWELGTTLTREAGKNLQKAIEFFERSFIPSVYQGET
ncbi:MAG TPA: hydrogenase maturation protease [Chitinophagaceae bacterium]|nr:hydrogenase maturation protease [Chitinophagaceae bacterium]